MQTGPVNTPSASPLLAVGKATAATTIMGLLLAILPFAPAIIVPFLALPLAHIVARRGTQYGLIVAVLSAALVYVGAGAPAAVLVLFFVLGIGVMLGRAILRGWKFEWSIALTAGGAFVAMVLWGLVLWLVFDVGLAWLREVAYSAIDDTAARYVQMGLNAESAEVVSGQLERLVNVIPFVSPGLAGMAAILLAVCSMGLAYLIFPRLREKVGVALCLSGFRMHWSAAYASIAGLAMLLLARGDGSWRTVVMYVGINVLLVSQTLFFVQGMAVARWFAVNRRMGRGTQVIFYVGATLAQMLFQLTGLVGLFDTWVDYRKRFARKSPDTGSTGGIHKE